VKIIIKNLDYPRARIIVHTDDLPPTIGHMSPDHLGIMQAAESGQLVQIGRTTYEPERSEVRR
jgi:hypothetical protein